MSNYQLYPQLTPKLGYSSKLQYKTHHDFKFEGMSSNYHYLFKFVVAGDAGVGKSTLIQQFTEESHRNTYIPTQRIHFASKTITINELMVKCQLWDIKQTADPQKHDGFIGLADSLCKKAASVLLLFDLSSKTSFNGLERWVQDIRMKCDQNISIVLVGNKVDKELRAVSNEEAEDFAKLASIRYIEVSSFEQKAVASLFQRVVKGILEKMEAEKESECTSELKSKIKRGKMQIQAPASSHCSSNQDKQKVKIWFDETKIEDSEELFSSIDKMAQALKKTCLLEEIIKKMKTNIREKGLYYLREIKQELETNKIAQSSSIIKDLFEIFSIIQECSSEQHMTLSRISLQNEELIKYKEVEAQITEDRQKIEQLQKKIEALTAQKNKLEQYKENSENREQNLLLMVDKIKKEKKVQIEKNSKLMAQLARLEHSNMQLMNEINRFKEEEEELNVKRLIQARQNSKIIDELQILEESGIDSSLLRQLRKKLSTGSCLNIPQNQNQLNTTV